MASTSSPTPRTRPPRDTNDSTDDGRRDSIIRRSWYAMSDILSPFSPSALASLPKRTFQRRPRYTRADNVPDAQEDEHGQMPTVRDYHAINHVPPQVRVPKKIPTPIKVEGKVWFSNERSMSGDRILWGLQAVVTRIISYSVDCLPADWGSYRNTRPRLVQCIEGRDCQELRVCVCGAQRCCSGALEPLHALSCRSPAVLGLRICSLPASYLYDSEERPGPFQYVSHATSTP